MELSSGRVLSQNLSDIEIVNSIGLRTGSMTNLLAALKAVNIAATVDLIGNCVAAHQSKFLA